MTIKLTKNLAANGAADAYDARQVKNALNRLGHYTPYAKTGMTGIPDAALFTGLKKYQKDKGLRASGQIKPDDETVKALNDDIAQKPDGHYIWRTVGDDKVRADHAKLNGQVRSWNDSPDPTEDYNCRCWAEPIEEKIIISDHKNRICIAIWNSLQRERGNLNEFYAQERKLDHDVKDLESEIKRLYNEIEKIIKEFLPNPEDLLKELMALESIAFLSQLGKALERAKLIYDLSIIATLLGGIENFKKQIKQIKENMKEVQKEIKEKEKVVQNLEQEFNVTCPAFFG